MWGYLAIGVTALVILRLFWMIDDWGRDWTTNHARLSTANTDPTLQPLEMNASVDDVAAMIEQWVGDRSSWRVENHESSDGGERFHLTRTTSVFRFVDDISIELTPLSKAADQPRTRFKAESQSRVGKGDLGQNPRNLRELRAGIAASVK